MSELSGRCDCGAVRYRLTASPLIVHCCHCSNCQRQTGSAFVVNALIETSNVVLMDASAEQLLQSTEVATPSGKGQTMVRCGRCQIPLWSHYHGMGKAIAFVRVGTLDHPALCPPDIHVYTSTKLPWVTLSDAAPIVPEFYKIREYWRPENVERFKRAQG